MERRNDTRNITVTEETTLRELLEMIGAVGRAEKTPTARALREKKHEDGTVVVVKHFCNISFEKFTMYVLLQMASSNHYTNGDGYDYTIRTHIS